MTMYIDVKKPDEEDRRRMIEELVREQGEQRMLQLTGMTSDQILNEWMTAVSIDPEVEGWLDITDAVCWRLRETAYPFLADAIITCSVKVVDGDNVLVGFSTHGWFLGDKLNYDQAQTVNAAVIDAAAEYGITVPPDDPAMTAWSGTSMAAVGSISIPDMTHPENIADIAKFIAELETTWPADEAEEPTHDDGPPEGVEAYILCATPDAVTQQEELRQELQDALGIELPGLDTMDNVRYICCKCGKGVVAGPFVPEGVKPICHDCFLDLPDIENAAHKMLSMQRQHFIDSGLPEGLVDAMHRAASAELVRLAKERREEREQSKKNHPSSGK